MADNGREMVTDEAEARLYELELATMEVPVVGVTPFLAHRFSEEAQRAIAAGGERVTRERLRQEIAVELRDLAINASCDADWGTDYPLILQSVGFIMAIIDREQAEARAEVERLRALTEWIPVSERLPEPGHDVDFVAASFHSKGLPRLYCGYRLDQRWYNTTRRHIIVTSEVICWRPRAMPPLPEEVRE